PGCREPKRAARLLLWRLLAAVEASRRGGGGCLAGQAAAAGEEEEEEEEEEEGGGAAAAMMPVQRLICFCRYFLWFTFLFDFTGLSSASLMLLEAESMKLSRSLVASLKSPASPPPTGAGPGCALPAGDSGGGVGTRASAPGQVHRCPPPSPPGYTDHKHPPKVCTRHPQITKPSPGQQHSTARSHSIPQTTPSRTSSGMPITSMSPPQAPSPLLQPRPRWHKMWDRARHCPSGSGDVLRLWHQAGRGHGASLN
uniref:Uncharacterized protein n=1 Tax=Anas platyrhynchos TaxID=8839 RepID=A0A8B9SFF8_ANAPL